MFPYFESTQRGKAAFLMKADDLLENQVEIQSNGSRLSSSHVEVVAEAFKFFCSMEH